MNLGGGHKDAKSWGNGIFRFNIMDMVKLITLVISAISILIAGIKYGDKLINTVSELVRGQYRIETKVDRVIVYTKTLPTKPEINHLWVERGKQMSKLDIRIKRVERKLNIENVDGFQDEPIDIINWDDALPIAWLDAKADGK